MKPAKWIKRFLHFTHRERNGLIVFVCLVIAIDLIGRYQDRKPIPVPASFFAKVRQIDSALAQQAEVERTHLSEYNAVELKSFDPNTHSFEELKARGVPDHIAQNLVRYRNAGGEYNEPGDVRKIYGMNDSIWDILQDYIIYPQKQKEKQKQRTALTFQKFDPNTVSLDSLTAWNLDERLAERWVRYRDGGKRFERREDLSEIYGMTDSLLDQIMPFVVWPDSLSESVVAYSDEREVNEFERIEINTADSIALVGVPGIGGYTAQKIIEWRESLGGFYSLEQLNDIYGIRDDNMALIQQHVKVDRGEMKMININQLNTEELAKHPYISFDLAEEIVRFRDQFRPFAKPDELQKLYEMSDDVYRKLAPYIAIE